MIVKTSLKPRFDRVFIEVTSQCNFDCSFCTNSLMQRKPGFMPFTTFKRIINEITKNGITNSILFHIMGDPLLHPDLMTFLRYSVEHVKKQQLVTNGSLFTEATVKECYETQLTNLDISYFTPNSTLFKSRNSKHITFQQYHQTIQNIVATKFKHRFDTHLRLFYPNINLKSFNWKGIPFEPLNKQVIPTIVHKWSTFITALGIQPNEIKHNEIKKWNMNKRNSIFITDDFEIVFKQFHNWHNSLQQVIQSPIGKCSIVLNHEQLGILWNGDVVLCCGDYEGHTRFGNINKKSLTEILNSEQYHRIVNSFSKGITPFTTCKKCLGSSSITSLIWNAVGKYYAQSLITKMSNSHCKAS
jgi:radical SAM protein with 4Fe4S-binding SPASM domain